MNNNPYFQNTLYRTTTPNQSMAPNYQNNIESIEQDLPLEQSYIENILRLNKGKVVTVYMTYPPNNDKVYKGIIEQSGRDHLIIRDPSNNKWYLLLMIYLDFIEFDERITYSKDFIPK